MNSASDYLLRVNGIRKERLGGSIFTGIPIDIDGNVIDARIYYVVIVPAKLLGGIRIKSGEWWKVTGEVKQRQVVTPNGFILHESQISAQTMEMKLPSGEHIIDLMARSPDFTGVGTVKARALWEAFSEHLYTVLDEGNVQPLSTIITEETARIVIEAWKNLAVNTKTLQWLHRKGFNVSLGRKIVDFYGADTQEKIEEDPYRLLSFDGQWSPVDNFAKTEFGVADDDPRRLRALIEEALYRILSDGHTCASIGMLKGKLRRLLQGSSEQSRLFDLIEKTLAAGESNGSYVIGYDGTVHPLGALIMETTVAKSISDRLLCQKDALLLDAQRINELIIEYEQEESELTGKEVRLNEQQCAAIHTASTSAIAVITGGAGTGKTTVLKALYKVFTNSGVVIHQVALAGRAAIRMQEATALPALTIASFLQKAKSMNFEGPSVLVIDECSMTDVIAMSRLCEAIAPHVRMVFVGDPSQLMPVGPGLILHAVAKLGEVPSVELKVTNRFGSQIAKAAQAIRDGKWPVIPQDEDAPIAFIPANCAKVRTEEGRLCALSETVLRLYQKDPENTQVLCAKRNGVDGTKELNAIFQGAFTDGAAALNLWNDELDIAEYSGFNLNDPILCTRNMWDKGLQNGSLGRISKIEPEPREIFDENSKSLGIVLAWAQWDDGNCRPILTSMLDDLELGYAITVHKAQGSQWPRVIVPVTGSALIDRTLIYTAVTRAQQQVILVGDPSAARNAVLALPKFSNRQTSLGAILERMIHEVSL
ncbi:AAA family ATPase [Noviherbaspirillum pedocola]|uniref:AAA family ATPase n=1 Tax=Noviherbaspirillum pedocola TaxID=2801341 RepID=A0A934SSW0_9BURK|nr:AAA family ATPase [Noviherbaspirillum pedocola]MBK4734628.1 AAA family ATPase [Noviherbaspirillum pedocola]